MSTPTYLSLQDVADITSLVDTNRALIILSPLDGSQGGTLALGTVPLSNYKTWITADVNTRIDNLISAPLPSIWPASITLSLGGVVTGSVALDGSSNVTLGTSIADAALSIAMVSGLGTALTDLESGTSIQDGVLTLSKLAPIGAGTLLGNNTAGAASPLALSSSQVRTLLSLDKVENTALSTYTGFDTRYWRMNATALPTNSATPTAAFWQDPSRIAYSAVASATGYPTSSGAVWSYVGGTGAVADNYTRTFDLFLDNAQPISRLWMRSYSTTGVAQSWEQLLTSHDEGSLDAGTLGGQAPSYYLSLANQTGILAVAQGGTGVGTLTGLVKGNGTSAFTAAIAGTDYVVPSGSITGNAGTATKLQTARKITLSGGAVSGATAFDGSADITIAVSSINMGAASGTLAPSHGGTGLSSFTAGYFLYAVDAATIGERSPANVLSDIGALPASSYTAADVLAKLLTVDGSGSGLDADTVRLHAPQSSTTDNTTNRLLITGAFGLGGAGIDVDWAATDATTRFMASATNGPLGTTTAMGFRVAMPNASLNSFGLAGRNNRAFFQTIESDVPGSWLELWHSGNFTPGNYLPLAGGTVTGPVTFSSAITLNAGGSITGDVTLAGDLIPDQDNVRSLGSTTLMWKDVYIGPGSLYINGQKVLSDSGTGQIIISADVSQDIVVRTTGSGGISLVPVDTGVISLRGTTQFASGYKVLSSDGNPINYGDSIQFDADHGIAGGLLIDGYTAWHSGNFNPANYLAAGGTAVAATALATARNFSLTGAATAAAMPFDGTTDVVLTVSAIDLTKGTGTLSVAQGGTGAATLSGILKGNGTAALSAATEGVDYIAPDTFPSLTQLTLSRDPASPMETATKQYVDNVSMGISVKHSVICATTVNITLSGLQTIDGYTTQAGDRVLVKNQTDATQNGIYDAATDAWTRSLDANTWAELEAAFVFVEEGTYNDWTGWVCAIPPGGTLGTTAVTWTQFAGSGTITEGAGIVVTGTQVSLATSGVAAGIYPKVTVDVYGRVTAGSALLAADIPSLDASIITTGALSIARGGTGATTALAAYTALSPMATLGDLVYYGASGPQALGIGVSGQLLTVVSGVPTWSNAPAAVTSVGLSAPLTVFNIVGSPVTSTGTLSLTFKSQSQGTFFAAPSTAAGTPAFRAIALSDISGALGSWTGSANLSTLGTITSGIWQGSAIGVAYGGTGLASYTAGNYINAASTSTLQQRTPAQVLADIGALSASAYTAADVLAKLKTVDGASSGLDADYLDGQHGSYYLNWVNFTNTPTTLAGYGITDGVTPSGSITGNAGTATKLQTARTIALSGDIIGTATAFDGSSNITIATTLTTLDIRALGSSDTFGALSKSGIYADTAQAADVPGGANGTLLMLRGATSGTGSDQAGQLYFDGVSQDVWVRGGNPFNVNGAWNPWSKVLTTTVLNPTTGAGASGNWNIGATSLTTNDTRPNYPYPWDRSGTYFGVDLKQISELNQPGASLQLPGTYASTLSLQSWSSYTSGIYNQIAQANGVLYTRNVAPSFTTFSDITVWQASTAYTVGQRVFPPSGNGFYYSVTVSGTTASAAPTWPTLDGQTVTDGTVTWQAHWPWGQWRQLLDSATDATILGNFTFSTLIKANAGLTVTGASSFAGASFSSNVSFSTQITLGQSPTLNTHAVTLGYLSVNYPSMAATGLGRTGVQALDAAQYNASVWANLPMGYVRAMDGASNTTAGGAPEAALGYFAKVANDASGGWAGLWISGGRDLYVGQAASSSVVPSWTKLWSSTNDGAGTGLDADLLDGQQGTYYLTWGNFTGTPTTLAGYGITDAVSFTTGDTRYILRRSGTSLTDANILPSGFWTNPVGIAFVSPGTGSANYPSTYGANWTFMATNGANSSAYGRTFDLFKSTSNGGLYWRDYSSTDGSANAWMSFWHSGNFNPANYLPVGGTAVLANALATARTIALSGAATGTATAFDGSANITIPVTSLDLTKGTGTLTVAQGGTGVATLTGLVKANGTAAFTAAVAGTDYVAPSGSITGNATTATRLQTARTIALSGGVTGTATSFDGTANITIPVTAVDMSSAAGTLAVSHGGTGVATLTGLVKANGTAAFSAAVAGTDYVLPSGSITGNAATATVLQTARTINGVSFDGSANITVLAVSPNALTLGNGLTAGTYDGSAAITVALGTPGTLGNGSTNNVTATSHTHALALVASDIPSLDVSKLTTGTLSVARGGTGATSLTGILKGNGTGAFSVAVVNSDYIAPNTAASLTSLTLASDPATAYQAATKNYVDNVALGLSVKSPVSCVAISNITLSGLQTIDGYALAAGDRVLVTGNTDATTNGIYVADTGTWLRSDDANSWNELKGAFVFVTDGTIYSGSGWSCNVHSAGTLGTTPITWAQFSGTGTLSQGVGIAINGNQIALATNGVTAGTYTKVTVDAYGRVSSGTSLAAADIPNLNTSILTAGTLPVARGGTGVGTLTGLVKANGTSAFTAAVAGTDYVAPSGSITGNAATATKLQTARTVALAGVVTGSTTFDGSANASITTSIAAGALSIAMVANLQSTLDAKALAANPSFTGTAFITGSTARLKLSDARGIFFIEGGLPDPTVTGGSLYLTGWNGTQADEIRFSAANVNINGQKIWYAGNDGAGSGLDADLLDGQQGSYYASTDHKYHAFVDGEYFFDTYQESNYLRVFTENAAYDNIRFVTPTNVEFYDYSATTPAWTSWSGGDVTIEPMLDGRQDTAVNIDHTHRTFRFEIQRVSGYPTMSLIVFQTFSSAIAFQPVTVTIETWDSTNSVWVVKSTSNFGAGTTSNGWGMHLKADAALHNGITKTRITIDITDWTDSGTYTAYPIKRLMLLSNYAGAPLQPWTWNFSRNVTFLNNAYVNSNVMWHAGNDGTGSGLDADLLDGLQSTAFLRADTGGTVSGPASISGLLTLTGQATGAATGAPMDVALSIEHASGGSSSIYFKSGISPTTEFGYIRFEDSYTGTGTNSQLTIGVQSNGAADRIQLKGFTLINADNLGTDPTKIVEFQYQSTTRGNIDNTGTLTLNGGALLGAGVSNQGTFTLTTATTTQSVLGSFATASYGSGRFTIQATSNGQRHISEILVVTDGTNAYATEYGVLVTGSSLFTLDVDVSSGNVRLLVTSASATSTVYNVAYTLLMA